MISISDAAKASSVSAKMIRYYERIGLVRIAGRTEAGYRTFDDGNVRTLRFVRRARDLGFTLDAIRRLMALWHDRSRSSHDVKRIALDTVTELRRTMAHLDGMARSLEHLAAHCLGDERPHCPIIDELAECGPSASQTRQAPSDVGLASVQNLLVGRAKADRTRPRR